MTTSVVPLPTGGSSFRLDSSTHPAISGNWSISGAPCHEGLANGMTVAIINSGALSATVLPGRGMGLWKMLGSGHEIGWQSPVRHGPVHPAYVNASRRGSIGWLDGFDELLCRCGLAFNGPPGKDDDGRDITLHGRSANLPAWKLEAHITTGSSPSVSIVGIVDECALFDTCLRLTTTYNMIPGESIIYITDTVENIGASPAEFQLLYHLNIGVPFLKPGSKAHVRFLEMAPQTTRAAEGIHTWQNYEAPTTGFSEQVYLFRPEPDANGNGLAVLERPDGQAALAVKFPVANLPSFTLWKNTGAIADGFVTGLEPATGFPNFKSYERKQQRIPILAPGATWNATWSMELAANSERVQELVSNTNCKGTVFSNPSPGFSPQGEQSTGSS
jgi:hypothetical protein